MRKPKLTLLIIIIFLVIPTIINLANIDDDSDTINLADEKKSTLTIDTRKPKSSGALDYRELWIDDSDVCGNGSWSDVAGMYSWCTWTGSEYILEDITLTNPDNTGSPLIIANSTVDFIIKNCSVSNSEAAYPHAGIKLVNASNGKILNCHISNNEYGMMLDGYGGDYSTDNEIKNNTIDNNNEIGIRINNLCDRIDIINNTITNNGLDAIDLRTSDDSVLENNTIDGCRYGAYLTGGDNVIVRNNTISNTGVGANAIYCGSTNSLILSGNTMLECGICLAFSVPSRYQNTIIHPNNTVNGKPVYYYKNQNWLNTNNFTYEGKPGQILLYDCHYSTISNFNLSDASIGIQLFYSSHNNISSNFIKNGPTGIRLYYSNKNNTIFNNTLNNQYSQGIYLGGYGSSYNADNNIVQNYISGTQYGISLYYSDYTNITHNTVKENNIGIYISQSDNNTVLENEIRENGRYGIDIITSNETRILKNDISNNGYSGTYDGIYLEGDGAFHTSITDNTIESNAGYGIKLYQSDFNNMTENVIRYNQEGGIYIDDGDARSDYNQIYLNFFKGNLNWHVYIMHQAIGNALNSSTIGNWWDNYTGTYSGGDGIGDDSHPVPEGEQDDLPIVDNTPPLITINDPDSSDNLGNNAPEFNVIVIDTYLYKMWYTLDNGNTNTTFTNNGTIDQALWDALNDGSVTIRFYAEDKTGLISSDQITVIKNPKPPILPAADDDDDDDDDKADDTGATVIIIIILVIAFVGAGILIFILLKKKGKKRSPISR